MAAVSADAIGLARKRTMKLYLFSLECQQQSQQLDDFSIEAKNDKLRYLEEVYTAQRKVGDLQTSLKVLESKLAEKDSEIRMLQDKKSNISSSAT